MRFSKPGSGSFSGEVLPRGGIGEAITPAGDIVLGPLVAQRVLALLGGSITVENQEHAGIQLSIFLTDRSTFMAEARAI